MNLRVTGKAVEIPDKPVGSVTYSQLCNQRGTIEADITVARVAEDKFLLVTGTAFGLHDSWWIRKHMPNDGTVTFQDVTSALARSSQQKNDTSFRP